VNSGLKYVPYFTDRQILSHLY